MPLVEVCLFLHAEYDYRSRSAFTDEQEGWDDYFVVSFFFAIKVIHSRASSRAPEPFLSTLWQCISLSAYDKDKEDEQSFKNLVQNTLQNYLFCIQVGLIKVFL